jgi:hypothetical protein
MERITATFVKRVDDDGDAIHCACCDYPAATTRHSSNAPGTSGPAFGEWYLCEVCFSTHLSDCVWYPQQCADPGLCRSVGWIANRLIDEIRNQNESGDAVASTGCEQRRRIQDNDSGL